MGLVHVANGTSVKYAIIQMNIASSIMCNLNVIVNERAGFGWVLQICRIPKLLKLLMSEMERNIRRSALEMLFG